MSSNSQIVVHKLHNSWLETKLVPEEQPNYEEQVLHGAVHRTPKTVSKRHVLNETVVTNFLLKVSYKKHILKVVMLVQNQQ